MYQRIRLKTLDLGTNLLLTQTLTELIHIKYI